MPYPQYKRDSCIVNRYTISDMYHTRTIVATFPKTYTCKLMEEQGQVKIHEEMVNYIAKMLIAKGVDILTGDVVNTIYVVLIVIKQNSVNGIQQQMVYLG